MNDDPRNHEPRVAARAAARGTTDRTAHHELGRGYAAGLVGVLIFSLTLPFTRVAVAELDPVFVALARAVVAGVLAALLLAVQRAPRPTRRQIGALAVCGAGVIIGFPLASSWAMRSLPASHGAVVIGLLPLATALAAAIRFGERPSARFWACALAGSGAVLAYATLSGLRAGAPLGLQPGDAWLLVAVASAAIGYAEGGRLARELGGPRTICWALVLALPLLTPVVATMAWTSAQRLAQVSAPAWAALGYVSVFSMLVGFFAWYRGLALGGIARVGQVQLLQPFLTIAFSALAFGEPVAPSTWAFALVVVACVAVGRGAPVRAAVGAAIPIQGGVR